MGKHITYVTIAFELYKNKILGQINAWQRRGYSCDLLFIDQTTHGYRLVLKNNIAQSTASDIEISNALEKRQAMKKLFEYLGTNCNGADEILYIRRLGINVILAGNLFKKIKAQVFYEIPTYPIDSGTTCLRKMVLKIEEYYFKRFVYPYILAEPACVQKKTKKLPSKMVEINNSVEVSNTDTMPRKSDNYTFLFFGNLQPWHGLDYFLEAVEKYTGINSVYVMVFSPATACYKELTEKYKESLKISFCGKTDPETIEVNNTNKTIGIGGLAYATRGADYDTSLKNKDYAAMGIPFIYTLPDQSFKTYKYSYQLNEIDAINIDEIIEWFLSIYTEDMYLKIKEYAREYLTYDKQIEKLYRMVEK